MKGDRVDVLDRGYVILRDHMGTDLTPVNAARASFRKRSEELNEADRRLIAFLCESDPPHTAPFRHAMVQFELHAPLMVCRQLWKHVIGSAHQEPLDIAMANAWNEASGRYIDMTEEFHIPDPSGWRGAPAKAKQGSSGYLPEIHGAGWTEKLMAHVNAGVLLYQQAKAAGVATEQARLFLPAYAMYTTWYWTLSLQAACHLLNLRLDGHAQWETRQYAGAVYQLIRPLFPLSIEHLVRREYREAQPC
jgi:thymidylate synthase (FAD)